MPKFLGKSSIPLPQHQRRHRTPSIPGPPLVRGGNRSEAEPKVAGVKRRQMDNRENRIENKVKVARGKWVPQGNRSAAKMDGVKRSQPERPKRSEVKRDEKGNPYQLIIYKSVALVQK
jgi:hypothetical protein